MKDSNKKLDLNTSIQAKVEANVAESLKLMSGHTKISQDEMINTALRRYIATHSDFFPPKNKK